MNTAVYVVHRALFGSFERFIGILIEHYGGDFPFWLAPVQARVVPVGEAHREAAQALRARLSAEGFRVEVDERDETLGKRIREAEVEKVPFVVVYGDRESDDALAVRGRGGEQSTLSLDELLEKFQGLAVAAGQRARKLASRTLDPRIEVRASLAHDQAATSSLCKQERIASSPPGRDPRGFNRVRLDGRSAAACSGFVVYEEGIESLVIGL